MLYRSEISPQQWHGTGKSNKQTNTHKRNKNILASPCPAWYPAFPFHLVLRGSKGATGKGLCQGRPTTYHIEFGHGPALSLSLVGGAVMPCVLLPRATEVIGHEAEELQVPARGVGRKSEGLVRRVEPSPFLAPPSPLTQCVAWGETCMVGAGSLLALGDAAA